MKASQFVVNNVFIVIENPLGLPIGNKINLEPYGAASGNRQPGLVRAIVAAVLRLLVCDLCGGSEGAR